MLGQEGRLVSVGGLVAVLVLVCVVVALVFKAAAPDWLPYALIGALALAILLSAWPLRVNAPQV